MMIARRWAFFAVGAIVLANPAPPSAAHPAAPRLRYADVDCLKTKTRTCRAHAITFLVTAPPLKLEPKVEEVIGQTFAEAGPLAPDAIASPPSAQAPPPPPDPTRGVHLLISLPQQKAWVFKDGELFDTAPVSTGRRGKETPTGTFPILQKKKRHFSNLYDNAPMPYMQRLTWGGVALHAGHLPGYPASHGCIRLPWSFAKKLFGLTNHSTTVTVTKESPSSAEEALGLV